MGHFAHKPDGYRYVREQRRWYCDTCGNETDGVQCRECRWRGSGQYKQEWWSLYEVRDGRSRRCGTARSESEYRAWLRLDDDANNPTTG